MSHDLYETRDQDRPDVICDSNGEVVLGLCKRCGKGEAQLYNPDGSPSPCAPKFKRGDRVRKTKGSQWHGTVVGEYSTELTPEGYAVESATEKGSVQIYPAAALEFWRIV